MRIGFIHFESSIEKYFERLTYFFFFFLSDKFETLVNGVDFKKMDQLKSSLGIFSLITFFTSFTLTKSKVHDFVERDARCYQDIEIRVKRLG